MNFSCFNFFKECRKYGFPLCQCPQFLFLILGIVVIASTIISYILGKQYIDDERVVLLLVFSVTGILFTISSVITNSFEKVAEASRMKTEFVGIISHQLKSPLSNFKWSLEMLTSGRLGKPTEKQREYFKILSENSGRMQELIKNLLIVAKLENSDPIFKKQKFSLEKLTKEVVKEFDMVAKASNIKVCFTKKNNIPDIVSDKEQLKIVISNLLDNAIRYIRKGGRVEISLEKKREGVVFKIQDTGVGIPLFDQKHIFEKFFRSENALKAQTEGSGLGLYIVKSIIKKLKGKVRFKSKDGKGSTFWFFLPA